MIRNYEIVYGIYLVQASHELDLHNDFDFNNFNYAVNGRKLTLNWACSKGDWVSSNTPKAVTIAFNEVSEFRFMQRDAEMPFTEDHCMHAFGYWVDEDWAEGIIIVEDDQNTEPHWLTAIGFMSGAVLAVQAERSYATILA